MSRVWLENRAKMAQRQFTNSKHSQTNRVQNNLDLRIMIHIDSTHVLKKREVDASTLDSTFLILRQIRNCAKLGAPYLMGRSSRARGDRLLPRQTLVELVGGSERYQHLMDVFVDIRVVAADFQASFVVWQHEDLNNLLVVRRWGRHVSVMIGERECKRC
jgi:hypothetical protein